MWPEFLWAPHRVPLPECPRILTVARTLFPTLCIEVGSRRGVMRPISHGVCDVSDAFVALIQLRISA